MIQLFLEDLAGYTDEEVRKHLVSSYGAKDSEISAYEILIAYESVGSWGCDSSSFFLLREKSTGSHCSCYGFEEQFNPEETTAEYLQSDKFYFSCGGYDDNSTNNHAAVLAYVQKEVSA